MKAKHFRLVTTARLFVTAALLAASLTALAPPPVAHAATFTVNTTDDEYNTDPAECSLREAIQSANTDAAFGGCSTGSGADAITLPANTYTLTGASGEDNNATGDLDLTSDITLNGAGADSTIIDANQLDRVVQVFFGSTVTLNGVTLRNGKTPHAAAGHCYGGGIYSTGTLTIRDSVVSGNTSGHWSIGCYGGGVYTESDPLTIENSTVSGNITGDANISGRPSAAAPSATTSPGTAPATASTVPAAGCSSRTAR